MPIAARALIVALTRFLAHDGWAIASHIALSALMSLFPFLIVVTAIAGLFGTQDLADEVGRLLLEAWPREVAEPIAREVASVLTSVRRDALTIGAVLAVYFASSGVESLRVGLNRAYDARETRPWWWLRLESIAWVLIGATALLAFAFLVVLGPLIWRGALAWAPALAPLSWMATFLRLGVATLAIVIALIVAHVLLPAERPPLARLAPGVGLTLAGWLIGGVTFGWYLDSFADAYVTTYAGLATAMIALVFLYVLACLFLIGGEFNAALDLLRRPPGRAGFPIGRAGA